MAFPSQDEAISPHLCRQVGPRHSPGSDHLVGSAMKVVDDTGESHGLRKRQFVSPPSQADSLQGSAVTVGGEPEQARSKRHFMHSPDTSPQSQGRRHLISESQRTSIGSGVLVTGPLLERKRSSMHWRREDQAGEIIFPWKSLDTSNGGSGSKHRGERQSPSVHGKSADQASEIIYSWPSSTSTGYELSFSVIPPYALHNNVEFIFCPPQRVPPVGKRREQIGDVLSSWPISTPLSSDQTRNKRSAPKSVHDALADAVGIPRRSIEC